MHLLIHAHFIEERGEWHPLEELFEVFASKDNLRNPTITEYLTSIKGETPA